MKWVSVFSPLDFYLWGYLNPILFSPSWKCRDTSLTSFQCMLHHSLLPRDLKRVRQSRINRVHACSDAGGGHFEHCVELWVDTQ
jgi:hypothetical protein